MDFSNMEIGGVPVIAMIISLVAIAKTWFGVSGNALRALSAALGILFGVLYQFLAGWPADAQGWVIFGVQLLYGVIASGLVDVSRDAISYAGRCGEGAKGAE